MGLLRTRVLKAGRLKLTGPAGLLLAAAALSACSSDGSGGAEAVASPAASASGSVSASVLQDAVDALPLESLSVDEADGMVYMREEEKLARDTYIALFDLWGSAVFDNISNSEQSHTDAVLYLLNRYAVTDPVGTNAQGVFTDVSLQGLYDSLIAQGSASLVDALLVGAAIEEIDLIDIQAQLDNHVDNQDIALVYENLLRGSRNHLRAFVQNLAAQGIVYQPQYLTQEVYDAVINAGMETG